MTYEHFGTIGLAETDTLSRGYDDIAEQTAMYPAFYQWVRRGLARLGSTRGASLLDVGCGTGRTLEEVSKLDVYSLAGVDFSQRCVEIAQERMPSADIHQASIMDGPLDRKFDVVLMSEVVEHLPDPVAGLRNVVASLQPGGKFVLTFPNKLAFWPWFYLRPLERFMPKGRALHWFRWFTMPCEMWSHQPIDHAYTTPEMRGFLESVGLRITAEDGFRAWPMWRIAGLDPLTRVVDAAEAALGPFLPKWIFYRYMFICELPS
ncbi:MAG TPA: class I SAM-dependent methyltransferase [Chloroflexota bacterium]|nr:class I SAM-dependent methyltransferase [Chloroflexota bacterium]